MKRLAAIIFAIFLIACSTIAIAHSGRTDGSGGHKDNKNASGLGSYHYHCGGNPPHLHSRGVCPYASGSTSSGTGSSGSGSSTNATRKPSSTATVKPTQRPMETVPPYLIEDDGYLEGFVYGETIVKNVNVRNSPSTKSDLITRIRDQGCMVEVSGVFYGNDGQMWYSIWLEKEKQEAFVLAEFINIILDVDVASGF
jgi:hypothetical protein